MTVTAKTLVETVVAPIAETQVYVAPSSTRTILDKFTGTNTTAAPISITVKLVPFGSAAGATNIISSVVPVAANASYTFPELVGHVLMSGDFISVIASAAGLNIRASGREVV